MKISLVSVSSVNGKTTKGSDHDIYSWTSKEDSKFFFSLVEKNNLIVMGSKTYESARKYIKHKKNKLRIVMTRDPQKYSKESIKGFLEYVKDSPLRLVEKMEKRGYKKMLLVGGSEINTLFLKAGLVDEIYLTLEPKIFGKGKGLSGKEDFSINLRLASVKRLNKEGTILLKYKVNYSSL